MSLNDKMASLARRLLAEKARRTQTSSPPSLEPEPQPEPEEVIILRIPIFTAAQLLRKFPA